MIEQEGTVAERGHGARGAASARAARARTKLGASVCQCPHSPLEATGHLSGQSDRVENDYHQC